MMGKMDNNTPYGLKEAHHIFLIKNKFSVFQIQPTPIFRCVDFTSSLKPKSKNGELKIEKAQRGRVEF